MRKPFTLIMALLAMGAMQFTNLQAQTVVTQTTPNTYTLTLPAGVATMTVECWGGGGAGGSAKTGASSQNAKGSGGAGGSYSKKTYTSPAAGDYSYVVGAGGVGAADPFVNGDYSGSGGNTTFATTEVVAQGGQGGKSAFAESGPSTTFVGGVASTSQNAGDLPFYSGGNGGTAGGGGNSGYGGGSAGNLGIGGAGSAVLAGTAGNGDAGKTGAVGGNGINTTAGIPTAGGAPGGGGAGNVIRQPDLNRYKIGASGGNGKIIITYTMAATHSSVAITAPTNKTVVPIDGSVEISATIALYAGKTFSSIVFKDGTTPITGTITNVGDVYSITYNNVPAGKRNITAELTDNTETVVSPISIIYGGPVVESGNKYAQSNITWSAGPWYSASTDGYVVSAPAAGDNVFTQGWAVTIPADATCDNLTLDNTINQIGLAAGVTLTVRGTLDCPVELAYNAFSASDATSILKLTGASLITAPYVLVTDKAATGMNPHNVVIETVTNAYEFGATAKEFSIGSGTFTVKTGSNLNVKTYLNLGSAVGNALIVEAGASVITNNNVRANGTNSSRIPSVTVNGTLEAKGNLNASTLLIGDNAVLKTGKSDRLDFLTFDGWWGAINTPTDVASFGTPTVLTFGTNSSIVFNKAGSQNVQGIVPANGATAAYSTPYVNLTLSGSGTKTVQANLTATGNLTVGSGVTLATAVDVIATVNGVVLNFGAITGTLVNTKTINVSSVDVAKGTVSGSVSGSTVSLIATPTSGNYFVNWTSGIDEVSSSATYEFAATENKTLVANFSIISGLTATNKSNSFVTVEGSTLRLHGDVNAVEVFDAQGRRIVSQRNVTSINVKSNGIYIVRMHNSKGVDTQKVSINKL